MASDGWIKLHRQIMEKPDWLAEPFTRAQAWVDLLLLANHKDGFIRKRGILIEVKRGQVGYSEEALAKRWRWSRGKLLRFLQQLIGRVQISRNPVQQNPRLSSLISITNYELYQGNGTTSSTTNGTGTRMKRKKEVIADHRISTLISFFHDEVLSSKGWKPEIDSGDAKAVQRALRGMTEEEIREAVSFYLRSEKAKTNGVTLKAALSTHSLNLWKQQQGATNWQQV